MAPGGGLELRERDPMSYTPSQNALAIYAQIDAFMSALTPPNTVLHDGAGRDPVTGTYLNIDTILDGISAQVGYQAQNDQAGGAFGNATAIYANVYSAWVLSIPTDASVSRNYRLDCDVSCFMSTAIDTAFFRLLVDGSPPSGQPTNAMSYFFNALTDHRRIHFTIPLTLSGGSHTFQMQFKTSGTGAVNTNGNDCCCMTLSY